MTNLRLGSKIPPLNVDDTEFSKFSQISTNFCIVDDAKMATHVTRVIVTRWKPRLWIVETDAQVEENILDILPMYQAHKYVHATQKKENVEEKEECFKRKLMHTKIILTTITGLSKS